MIRHVLSEAFNALAHYRLRAGLTMLSIVWGVVSLLLLLAYGRGFGTALNLAWDQTGKNLIVLFPGQTSLQAGGERAGRRIMLELADVQALQEGVPAIEAVSPESRRYLPVAFHHRLRSYSICGVHAAFERIRGMELAEGRFLGEDDVQQRHRVAVIGANVQKELFGGQPALGRDIRIGGMRFTVIGLLRKKTQITNYSTPDDMSVFIPHPALSMLVDTRYLDNVVVLPVSNQFRSRVIGEMRATLARLHHFSIRDERAVDIKDWNEFRAIIDGLSLGLNIMLTTIGALTLSIGAVGVMNIMLVSVAERTREIGVLKALGARRSLILGQILAEGLAITLSGGIAGFLLAALIMRLIGSLPLLGPLFEDTSGRGDIHLGLSLPAVLVAISVLTVVGLVAGLVPALRAARLDPVQAFRSD